MKSLRRRLAVVLIAGLVVPSTTVPTFAQVPGNKGFGFLLCVADALGSVELKNDGDNFVVFGGRVLVTVTSAGTIDTGSNSSDGDNILQTELEITHGGTSSTHVITYEDNNGSGGLGCGDTIISIS